MGKILIILIATIVGVLGVPTHRLQPNGLNNNGRIIGGSVAPEGAFPYQITMKDNSGKHACGGSIIGRNIILTAAHCVIGKSVNSLTVVVGTNKISSGGTNHKIEKITVHEGYNRKTAEHDIALLKLSSPIEYTGNVAEIPLETQELDIGASVTLSGWGQISYPGSTPDDLQYIDLKIVDNTKCGLSHIFNRPVFDTEYCTLTVRGEGVCHGDSGGPLVANGKQVGVVSWGQPCATGVPDVFTKVSSYIDWIDVNSK